MRKLGEIFLLSALILVCLPACGRIPSVESKDSASVADIATGSAVHTVASHKAETVSLERNDCKVDLQIPAKDQVKRIYQEKSLWYWEPQNAKDDDADFPDFAVTDFDQDGYLEIFVMKDSHGQPALYEVNRQGKGLIECQLSEEEFQELMYNPVCSYQEKESGKWHLGKESSEQNGEVKKFYMQYDTEWFIIEDDTEEGVLEALLYLWEEFAVYEALDVSAWEKKLTEDERKQICLIADSLGNYETADENYIEDYIEERADYAVCDLNQDGRLDLLMRISIGSGILREFYICVSVDEENANKEIMDGEGKRRDSGKPSMEAGEEGEESSVQTAESIIDGLKVFLSPLRADEFSCYQNADSGEIRYVFEAREEGAGYGSSPEQYEMFWNGNELFIESPQEKKTNTPDKQGKAVIRWVDRCYMACPDYLYENALASYLGWELRWMEATE